MVAFHGFETKEQADKFKKEHGGLICTKYTKTGRKSKTYTDYMFAVCFGGLDEKKYPYCVQWNE